MNKYLLYPSIILDNLIVGAWMAIIGIGYFLLTYWIYPDYIEVFWIHDKIPIKNVYYGVPLMDIIWYFLMGLFNRMLQSLWIVLYTRPGDTFDKALS